MKFDCERFAEIFCNVTFYKSDMFDNLNIYFTDFNCYFNYLIIHVSLFNYKIVEMIVRYLKYRTISNALADVNVS